MCQLLETICCRDGQFLNLPLHEQRMRHSGDALFPLHKPYQLTQQLNQAAPTVAGLVKCRVLYSNTIDEITFAPYTPRLLTTFTLVNADTLEYQHKFADRSSLEQLKQSVSADEIIIVQQGLLTDVSFANLAFFDGFNWVTPAKPLLYGTQRQMLLQQGILITGEITLASLHQYQSFKLINAMLAWDESVVYPIKCITNLTDVPSNEA